MEKRSAEKRMAESGTWLKKRFMSSLVRASVCLPPTTKGVPGYSGGELTDSEAGMPATSVTCSSWMQR